METYEVFKRFDGQRVFIALKGGRIYTGVVSEIVDAGNGLIFISIIDKFNKWVTLTSSEIEVIQGEPK